MKSLSILLLAWILPAFVYSNCVPNKWADYGEQKLKYVATSADNNHLWGIGPDDDVYYKASGGNWQLVPTPEKILVLSVGADGNKIWAINWQGNDLIRYGGINGEWSLVNDNVKNWIDITVSADGEHIAGIDESGAVWDRKGETSATPWVRRTGTLKVVSYSGDGSIGWGVDFDGDVFYRGGYSAKWLQVTGNLKYIEVSEDGQHVWGTNFADIIYYRNGKLDFWKGMQGRAKQITVSGDGSHVYAVDRNDDVHYLNGYPGFFQPDNRAARNLGGAKMVEVTVSESGDNIYGVDSNNEAWHTRGIDHPWIRVPGSYISLSVAQEDELWTVNPENKMMWRVAPNTPFIEINGSYMYVEASADGKHVWGINSPHYVMFYLQDNNRFKSIDEADARAKQISVSANGDHVWYVNPINVVYYRNGYGAVQQDISPDLKLRQISVSGDGNHVWGVGADNKKVYYRDGVAGTWIEAEAPELDYVSVSGDGTTLYGINKDTGNTYYRYC